MTRPESFTVMLLQMILILPFLVLGAPRPQETPLAPSTASPPSSSYWLAQIQRQGTVGFGSDPSYKMFRNVKDYGAIGDGSTDDTAAINLAISDQSRCGFGCDSSTVLPALVYFPPGTYAISSPVVMYYYTQLVGDAVTPPIIVALPSFQGIAMLDSDPYIPGTDTNWFTNQNNFFRQVRNFVIDMTRLPENTGAGIHWQVAQATSLQNIVFNMLPKSPTNKQSGIFMDNGSGGFIGDLVFNGGNYGAFLGNQQFTSRNLTFRGCNTAIYMNWNWVWLLKSVDIDGCDIGIDMSNLANGVNQTVGSVLLLDSLIKNAQIGIKTAYNSSSLPKTGGTLTVQNVDFTGTNSAISGADGTTVILQGGSLIGSFAQGDAYVPNSQPVRAKRAPQDLPTTTADTCSEMSAATETATVSPLPESDTASASPVSSSESTATDRTSVPPVSASPSVCTISAIPVQSTTLQQVLTAPTMPPSLLNGNVVFERSKPQYENISASLFVSIKSGGAKGDGVTDDSDAIESVLNSTTTDKIVYFDHGAYVITRTIKVPKDIRITGEIWPLIMITGSAFSDRNNPTPAFMVGMPGDTGNVEISDIIFETIGAAPGAIMMQWNVAEASQGSCGMWDTHFRVGASAGTQLQQDVCIGGNATDGVFKPECAGSFLMMHVTQQSTAYLENCWFWLADHELDIFPHNQTNIFNGRGLLVESQGPVWLWGTSSEHHQLYNYQISNAKDVFMGVIQTETAYMQSKPNALEGGFTPNPGFSDPEFADCTTDSCKKTWGLRIVDSSDIYMYGGGMYSFFEDYTQQCLDTESCQENMVDIQCSTDVFLYGLTTKASTNMVNVDGQPSLSRKTTPTALVRLWHCSIRLDRGRTWYISIFEEYGTGSWP